MFALLYFEKNRESESSDVYFPPPPTALVKILISSQAWFASRVKNLHVTGFISKWEDGLGLYNRYAGVGMYSALYTRTACGCMVCFLWENSIFARYVSLHTSPGTGYRDFRFSSLCFFALLFPSLDIGLFYYSWWMCDTIVRFCRSLQEWDLYLLIFCYVYQYHSNKMSLSRDTVNYSFWTFYLYIYLILDR